MIGTLRVIKEVGVFSTVQTTYYISAISIQFHMGLAFYKTLKNNLFMKVNSTMEESKAMAYIPNTITNIAMKEKLIMKVNQRQVS